MKAHHSKLIIFFIIFILIVYAVYHIFFNNKSIKIADEETQKKETFITNNIRIGIVDFDVINPILSSNRNVQEISKLIFEPLINLTEDFRLQACLAKEWTKLDDVTYLIKLNENVTWQDGKKFDSDDVIFTINMIKNNESIYSYNVEDIKSVEKIDEYTLKIITKEKIPYFEYKLIFPILSSKYFDQTDFKSEEKNKNPVGTGMYYISESNSNTITLKRNLEWAERNNIELKLDYIKCNLYKNINQLLMEFKNKNIDILTTSNLNIESYLENTQYNKIEFINRNYSYILFNCNNNILKNIETRQAIASAINKEEINEKIYYNKFKLSNFPIDFGCYLYNQTGERQANITETKKILEQEKWIYENGNWRKKVDDKYLTLKFNLLVKEEENEEVKTAELIQEQLEKVGIKITIKKVNEKQYRKQVEAANYEIAIASKTFGYSPDLESCLGENNLSKYKNKEMNDLLNKLENTSDETKKQEILSEIIKIYKDEIPFISLYYDTLTMIYSPNLKGNLSPTSYNIFYNIENWYREYEK